MSKVLAREVYVQVGDAYVAGQTDCGINVTTVFDTSQTKADNAPVDTPSYLDWEITVSGELGKEGTGDVTIGQMQGYVKNGTKVSVLYVIGAMGAYGGEAILTSYQLTAPVEGKTTYSATFKGVSALSSTSAVTTLIEE
jgi:hypothetical protein